ncbi:hypothetical protein KORDIASMS9_04371 [Kordia sp. SMS9]|uniref:hypothetical protein n=1 Tax=Kordia sp. SMS9 TaxID=2282170 RepID=UPI000E0D4A9D|nr:hypothetical protein [Kordia sp. SMS9]AXG72108.1 hypothetical protein KORDIASMS9_04371 [Kordia sp. SMS9]
MKSTYTTGIYLVLVLSGGGLLLFREEFKGETQLVITIFAVFALMFGLYKMNASLTSNRPKAYKHQEHFNREEYSKKEALKEKKDNHKES